MYDFPYCLQVIKIPPVYERSTTSNISIEQVDKLHYSESCKNQVPLSSVSRGVKYQPKDMIFGQKKLDTVPLLSPNMETEMVKKSVDNAYAITPADFKLGDEDNTMFPVWKEDFQDLTNWCMAIFQEQCDFPVGESAMESKISGMRYEGSDVSTAEEGFTRGLNCVLGTGTFKDNIAQIPTTSAKHHGQEYNSNGHAGSNENKNTTDIASSSWSCPAISDTSQIVKQEMSNQPNQMNTNSVSWPEVYNGLEPDVPLYSDTISNNADSHDSDKMLFVNDPTDACNVFPILEPNGIDDFDLLSYVCDEMPSSVSNVSTGSGKTYETKFSMSSPSTSAATEPAKKAPRSRAVIEPRNNRKTKRNKEASDCEEEVAEKKSEDQPRYTTRSGGVYTKHIKEEAPDSPESSRKNSWSPRRSYTASKGAKRKRMTDSDSEDEDNYRESREKNNEASRKSRMNKKAKEMEMCSKANELEKENRILKMKVQELEKLVTSMRNALLKSALDRNSNQSKRI